MDVAKRIAATRAMQPIDKIDRVRAAADNRSDPRILLFKCGQEAGNNAAADTGAVAAQAPTPGEFRTR